MPLPLRFRRLAVLTLGLLLMPGLARADAQRSTGAPRTFTVAKSVPKTTKASKAVKNSRTKSGKSTATSARKTARRPPARESMKTTVGVGYIQGSDVGAQVTASGTASGLRVSVNGLVTRGLRGTRLETGSLSVVSRGGTVQLDALDLFSPLAGISRGARVSYRWKGQDTGLSLYGPRPLDRDRRTVGSVRQQMTFGRWVAAEGEWLTDRSQMIGSHVRVSRVGLGAQYIEREAPVPVISRNFFGSVDLWRGLRVGGDRVVTDLPGGRDTSWRLSLQVRVTRQVTLGYEHASYTRPDRVSQTQAFFGALDAGGLRISQRYQQGEVLATRNGVDELFERQWLQSRASYSTGSRFQVAMQQRSEWTPTGRGATWQELRIVSTPWRGTALSLARPVTLMGQAGADRVRARLEQELPSRFSIRADYGILTSYQGLVEGADRPRLSIMVRKTLDIATPAHGGQVRGRVVDQLGHPVAGARVVLGPYAVDADDEGRYEFRNLPKGDYQVGLDPRELPADYAWDGRDVPVRVTGETREAVDLLVAPLNAIHGRVYGDRNGNGRYDSGEGLAGVPVRLGARVTSTDLEGRYDFYNVPPGRHRIDLDVARIPAGWKPDNQTSLEAELVDESPVTGADFRLLPTLAKPILMEAVKRVAKS